jgi:hypothetical protein
MNLQLQNLMKNPENTTQMYQLAQQYENSGEIGEAYFFYWLAQHYQKNCTEELERTWRLHPYGDLMTKAKTGNLAVQISAIEALASFSGNGAVSTLVELLPNTMWQVRYRALKALEGIACYFSATFIHTLIRDPEEVIRQHTAICLGKLGFPSSPLYLLKMLEDEDAVVRQLAIRSLGYFSLSPELEVQLQKMLDDSDAFVRKSARETLKNQQNPQELPLRKTEISIQPF